MAGCQVPEPEFDLHVHGILFQRFDERVVGVEVSIIEGNVLLAGDASEILGGEWSVRFERVFPSPGKRALQLAYYLELDDHSDCTPGDPAWLLPLEKYDQPERQDVIVHGDDPTNPDACEVISPVGPE